MSGKMVNYRKNVQYLPKKHLGCVIIKREIALLKTYMLLYKKK